jgi:hypothetical protein
MMFFILSFSSNKPNNIRNTNVVFAFTEFDEQFMESGTEIRKIQQIRSSFDEL